VGRATVSLEMVRVASPCTADWDATHGDDRVRYCGQCNLHVYNLSGGISVVAPSGFVARPACVK
jgi:hypothetical protein